VALALLNLLVVLSYVANSSGPNGAQISLSTEYFLSRSALGATVVLLSDEEPDSLKRWSQAIGMLALFLAVFRLSQMMGLPVKTAADALGISVLGDYLDSPNANLYAVLLGIGIPLLLAWFSKDGDRVESGKTIRWIGAAIVTLAMASTASRTGAVIIVVVIGVLLVSARSTISRVAVGALAAVYVLGSLLPSLSVVQRPVVVASTTVPDHVVATNQAPIVAPTQTLVGQPSPPPIQYHALPAMRPQWRSVLDRTSYRLEQSIPSATTFGSGDYIVFSGAAGGGGSGVTLLINVNGTLVAQLKPTDMTTDYRWHEVQIPDYLALQGKTMTVGFTVAGSPDSTRDYFLIGGVNATSEGYRTRIWTGEFWSQADVSSDPGSQSGLLMTFLDGVIPPLKYFDKSSDAVIDTSIEDRLTLWRTALNVFLHNPLLGTGFYSFGEVRSQYTPSGTTIFYPYANAHSNYFQLLADLGAAGPILLALIYIMPLARVARSVLSDPRRISWFSLAFALALLTCLISSVTQTWIADSRFYVLSWFLALVAGGTAWTTERRFTSRATISERASTETHAILGDAGRSRRA